MFLASQRHVDTSKRKLGITSCWLDASPTFLLPREQEKVDAAKEQIGRDSRKHTPGRLISKLGFGFWTALWNRPYDHGRANGPKLWPALIPNVLPGIPKHLRIRVEVEHRLNHIRDFRNRIAHHEPIWDRDLPASLRECNDVLAWLNAGLPGCTNACAEIDGIRIAGHAAYRPLAKTILAVA